jgi:hypothetical protein
MCVVAFILLGATAQLANAQGLAGIRGTITDQSGAVVVGAKITVTNDATNVSTHAVATSSGTYTITDLIPGAYTVKIESPNFATAVLKGVNVEPSRNSSADAVLVAGAVTETLEVVADQVSLETTQPQLGALIENKLVQETPVIIGNSGRGRQIDDYIFFAPGVQGGEFSHRINGGVDFENEVVFNGVAAAQSETQGMQTIINPPFEMVSEIQVLTSNFSAQYGLAQGVASYQFASGTNQLHGDGFEVLRNTALNAAGVQGSLDSNNVFHKSPAQSIHQNNFGFSVGGPVIIPKLYNGKDKTFFHVSSEWFRLNKAGTGQYTVPTQAQVGGDFSGYGTTDPNTGTFTQIPIFVPQGFVAPSGCTAPAPGQQWIGNVIPTTCFSTTSQSLLGLIPKPDLTGLVKNGISHLGVLPTRQTNWGFSIDHNLTERQKVHGSFFRDKQVNTGVGGLLVANELAGAETDPDLGTGIFLTYSNSLSNSLVMTAGVGWLGEINNQLNTYLGHPFAGVTNSISLPAIRFDSPNNSSLQPTQWGLNSNGETYSKNRKLGISFDNNFLYTHGRHTMNIGWEIRRTYQDDQECQQCGGGFHFNAQTTSDPKNILKTGSAFASYLLGYVDSTQRQFVVENRLRNLAFSPYFQDDIKVTPNLTVNAGLRWDILRPFTEKGDNVLFFDPTVSNPGAITPGGTPLLGAANKLGNCAACAGYRRANIDWKNFSPRLGFAYRLSAKSVVLGGFAINYLDGGAYEYGTNKIAVNYGSLLGGIFNVNSLGSNIPGYGQWDGQSIPVPSATQFTNRGFLNSTGVLRQFGRNPGRLPYTESWNVGYQRELPSQMFLSVAYVGNRSLHLPSLLNPINQTNPKYLQEFCPSANPSDPNCLLSPSNQPNSTWTSAASQAALQTAGFSSATVACPNGGPSGTFFTPYVNFLCDYGAGAGLQQALLPYPQFNPSGSCGGICNNFDTNGTAFYNAVQVQTQKRFSSGLSFLVAYTLSKTMSNTDTGFSTFNFGSENKFNQKSEYSIAGNDQKHLLNISGVYELPIGPGKKFLGKGGQLAKNLLGGWQISGVFNYASGTPLTISTKANDPYLNGFNRTNFDPKVALHLNYNNYYRGLPVFNTAAFSDPGFAQGNEPRALSQLRNPFTSNENVGLAKHLYLGERVTAEFRVEFFNVLNRVLICGPDTTLSDGSSFGVVSGPCQNNTPRQGQAFLKISF